MSINGELNWACRICAELGISDPVAWLDSVDGKVFDLWVAYFSRQQGMRQDNGANR